MQAKYKAIADARSRAWVQHALAGATDLTIHLNGTQPVSRKTVQYQCDAQGAAMGLPATAFPVEYINGAGNSLAVVPVHGSIADLCQCHLRLWRTLCGRAIYLVGSSRIG